MRGGECFRGRDRPSGPLSGCGRLAAAVLGGLLAILLDFTVLAAGQPVRCVMTGEDIGNGYEYTAPGIGSFTVNGMEGDTFQAAVFDIGEDLYPVLYRDGERTDFDSGMALDSGSYELRIYRSEEQEGDYGVFFFTVENDYAGFLDGDRSRIQVVENPPLKLEYQAQGACFRYVLPDGQWFESNVPVGGWSRMGAQISLSDGLNVYRVRRDGEPVDFTDGLSFVETGSYEILARDNELGLEDRASYCVTFGFHLYRNRKLNLSLIPAPQGLAFAEASFEGKKLPVSGSYLWLEEDGDYRISFADADGRVCWQMELVRDTTPPALLFTPYADGRVLSEAVSFRSEDPHTQISILRGGEPVQASLGKIAVNGVYHMDASDEAGNVRGYDFEVRVRYRIPAMAWLIIPFILLSACGACFAYWRRDMRIL